jgi:aminopeptidase N
VVDLGNGNTRYEWKTSYPIDYYLISFDVSDYQDYSIYAHPDEMGDDSLLIQNLIYNTPQCLEDKRASIDAMAGMIELYSDLYILYPFSDEKYGTCLTELGGGMEHQTMTTLGSYWFGLAAHEMGHMWFGDNVTCATWSDIWVNEGFATYSDYLCRYYIQGEGSGNSFMQDKQSSAMSEPGGTIYIPEDEIYPGNEWRIFSGRLSYNKGAAIIHTLRHEIQDSALFFNVLGTFQTEYGGSTATGEDFKNTAEEVTGMDFDQFFDQWYYGEGYPIYDFVWYSTDDHFYLTSTQSTSASTPFFDMLLDVKLIFTDYSDTIITVHQTDNVNEFSVYTGKTVAVIQIDPNNWTMELVNSISVGIEETEKPVYFTLGPVPADDHINVYFLNPSGNTKTIKVTDISGKILTEAQSRDKHVRLNISGLAKGVYLVSVDDGSDMLVKKFVK